VLLRQNKRGIIVVHDTKVYKKIIKGLNLKKIC
jgi:hypothetical protein